MIKSLRIDNPKGLLLFILIFLISTDLAVLLDIPILRQISGFIFLTFIPGVLLLYILKLNKLVGLAERIVLSLGLSVAFTMFFGLVINSLSLAIGYTRPLSTIPVLVSFSAAAIILAVIACIRNKGSTISFSNFNLTRGEKAFLIVPLLFPLLSIVGMRIMDLTDNNLLLMLLLFLIPAYVIFIAFFNRQVSERVYPVTIFLIGISLLLMMSLRSSHILGSDIHDWYYAFQLTFQEGHWRLLSMGLIDACLSISLLPTIYQSLMDINTEYLFKLLYPLFFSVSPLVIYIIAKKYIGGFYAFLAALLFMAQVGFINSTGSSTTNTAILFFALAIMVLFHQDIGEFARRLFFIIFAASSIVSHYSTSYIFFFVLLLTWLGMQGIPRVLPRERKAAGPSENPIAGSNPRSSLPDGVPLQTNIGVPESIAAGVTQSQLKKGVTITIVALFFVLLFFWYSQITIAAFGIGVGFIELVLVNLNEWFLIEAKGATIAAAVGEGVNIIPQRIRLVVSWLTVAFIAIGVLSTVVGYRRTVSTPSSGHIKLNLLHSKFEMEFLMFGLATSAILVVSVVLPYVMTGYSMERTFFQMLAILSTFFVIGGIMVAKWIRARPHWIILVVLIPFFMCTTGTMYQIFGVPASRALNSAGRSYEYTYVHPQDSFSARWLKEYSGGATIYTYPDLTSRILESQGQIPRHLTMASFISLYQEGKKIDSYIYLRYTNIAVDRVLTEYPGIFVGKDKIYTTGGSEVFR